VDYHDYALSAESLFAGIADDGSDPGVDFEKLDSAFVVNSGCPDVMTSTKSEIRQMNSCVVFPNPVQDVLYLNCKDAVGFYYSIMDISGREMMSGRCEQATMEIPINNLCPGNYLLIMRYKNARESYRLVLQ